MGKRGVVQDPAHPRRRTAGRVRAIGAAVSWCEVSLARPSRAPKVTLSSGCGLRDTARRRRSRSPRSLRTRMRRWEDDVRVLLVPNTASPGRSAASVELATWCTAGGFEPVLDHRTPPRPGSLVRRHRRRDRRARAGGRPWRRRDDHQGRPPYRRGRGAGSRRELRASRISDRCRRPRRARGVQASLAGDARIERRATLRADVAMDGRSVGSYRALNEVFVGRGRIGRVIAFELVSTATGS